MEMVHEQIKNENKERNGERGAALVMALLISFLLLAASARIDPGIFNKFVAYY